MTSEQRLDRLERIAKLFVRAGVRYRRDLRELGEKLNIMVNMQMQNGERFAQNEAIFQFRFAEYEKRFNRDEERLAKNEERLAKLAENTDQKFVELAESQVRTDRNLAELIKIVRRGRNGNPQTDS
jgi:hypothetical protein